MDDITLTLIDTFEEAEAFMRWLGERRDSVIAVDTETAGFDWWRDELRLVQVGDATHGWAMRWDRWSGLFESFIRRYDDTIAMHNFKFDVEFIQRNGIEMPLHRIDDTRTLAHLVDPHRLTGLKPLADSLFGRGMSTSQTRLAQFFKMHNWTWRDVPYSLQEYWAYAAADTVLTSLIHAPLMSQLRSAGDRRTALYDVEMAAQIALMRMEMKGCRIDLDYATTKGAELRQWAESARQWAADEYDGLNIGSADQVSALLMSDGWKPKEFTATGKPKFTKEIVAQIDHPLAKLQLQVKHAEKMASSYFDNFLAGAEGDILHPSINPLGAVTGRMSTTRPALQTLPRDALVRDAFIPRDGNRLVLIDYDAMEVRLTAHFDDTGQLAHDVLTSPDIHAHNASLVYGVPLAEVSKTQRQIAKNGIYTIIYGGGVNKLAETVGIPTTEAKEFMDAFRRAQPGVFAWKSTLERESRQRGGDSGWAEAETPRGRRQRAPLDKCYKLANYVVQGSGADVLKTKIAALDAAGLGEYMVLPVHDEIVFDVAADEADEVMAEACMVMTDATWRVPLTVQGTIVDRWGDKYRKEAA